MVSTFCHFSFAKSAAKFCHSFSTSGGLVLAPLEVNRYLYFSSVARLVCCCYLVRTSLKPTLRGLSILTNESKLLRANRRQCPRQCSLVNWIMFPLNFKASRVLNEIRRAVWEQRWFPASMRLRMFVTSDIFSAMSLVVDQSFEWQKLCENWDDFLQSLWILFKVKVTYAVHVGRYLFRFVTFYFTWLRITFT